MNYRMIARITGYAMLMEAALMLPSIGIALFHGESVLGFCAAIGCLVSIGLAALSRKPERHDIYAREGFVTVSLCWIVLSIFGAMPFYLEGITPTFVDALFETVSGFTTTGASVLSAVEGLPYGILFWRSFTHWIGGMGVLVFMMAVLPMADNRNMHIMRAEVPGPVVGKLVPRAKDTALILYGIYIALTLIETVLLLMGGMPLFDAFVHAVGTAGTGGFSIKNSSIAYYDSAYIDIVISVFMLLFSINFNLYFFILLGNIRSVIKNEELRWFLCIVGASVLAIALNINHLYGSFGEAVRYALFQVGTVVSTTGYATADFNLWPEFSRALMVGLMLMGACAGSTGGGIKVSRIMILAKSATCEIRRMMHPRSVNLVKLEGKSVSDEVVHNTLIFFVMYMFFIVVSTVIVALLDQASFTTSLTSVIACISNIGPGLEAVGATGNYGFYSAASKLILSLNMLIGRLEIFPMIMLFSANTWKRV
ncbi:MAG: TrkH family potassium uptake protein [Clostridia bacterium]|nr:TrkH family potassium uptake protein [Clostridia bacterium]